MDFFNDDFGFGDSPNPRANKNTKKNQPFKAALPNDGLDDLLDEMLQRQKKKTKKQTEAAPSFSSLTSIDKPTSPIKQPQNNSITSKTGFQNNKNDANDCIGLKNDFDVAKAYEPMRNRQSSKSIAGDQKGSEDNRSYKSGATGFVGLGDDPLKGSNMDGLSDLPNVRSNSRMMMKPPIRKRAQSKVGSQIGQQDLMNPSLNVNDLENINMMRPPLPRKDPSPPKNQPSSSNYLVPPLSIPNRSVSDQNIQPPTIQQKIVYVKQDQKAILEQHQKQISLMKQSHEKQLKILKQELEKQIKSSKDLKIKMMKQYEEERKKQREMYQMMSKRQSQRIKQMYEWEIKRKTQMYELEIQRLKKLSQLTIKSTSFQQNSTTMFSTSHPLEHELKIKQQKLDSIQLSLKNREKALEQRQSEFNSYRKLQQNKLSDQRKELYKLQNQLNKKKLQLRKNTEEEKISMTSDLSKQMFQVTRQKDRVTLERRELQVQRELFQKQKQEYQQFNDNIMKQLKRKMKQVQTEKDYYQQKQIQLYKKIQTVQMMGNLKSKAIRGQKNKSNEQNQNKNESNMQKTKKIQQNVQQRRKMNKTEQQQNEEQKNKVQINNNNKNKSKSRENLYSFSPPQFENQKYKDSYAEHDQSFRRSSLLQGSRTNLKEYLLKINKGNLRRPILG